MSTDILKARILELETQRFIDLPHSGFKASVSAKRPGLISLVKEEFSVDDEGTVFNHNATNGLTLEQFFEGGIAGHNLFYDEVFLEAKKIKAEMELYPDTSLKKKTERELWDMSTEIAEKRLAKSERGRAA